MSARSSASSGASRPSTQLRGPERVRQRIAQRGQLARARRVERDAPADAFEVGHGVQLGGELRRRSVDSSRASTAAWRRAASAWLRSG